MTDAIYAVTYVSKMIDNSRHPRRVEHLGEEAASALARELARKESISDVVVERWECVSRADVR